MATNNSLNLPIIDRGTFTPSFTGSTINPTSLTYAIQNGFYTSYGEIIAFTLTMTLSAITIGSAAGSLQISGLPFTSDNVTNKQYSFSIKCDAISGTGTYNSMSANLQPNATLMTLWGSKSTGSGNISVTNLNSTSTITVSGTYIMN